MTKVAVERVGNTKLSQERYDELRRILQQVTPGKFRPGPGKRSDGLSHRALARQFGISPRRVGQIAAEVRRNPAAPPHLVGIRAMQRGPGGRWTKGTVLALPPTPDRPEPAFAGRSKPLAAFASLKRRGGLR